MGGQSVAFKYTTFPCKIQTELGSPTRELSSFFLGRILVLCSLIVGTACSDENTGPNPIGVDLAPFTYVKPDGPGNLSIQVSNRSTGVVVKTLNDHDIQTLEADITMGAVMVSAHVDLMPGIYDVYLIWTPTVVGEEPITLEHVIVTVHADGTVTVAEPGPIVVGM